MNRVLNLVILRKNLYSKNLLINSKRLNSSENKGPVTNVSQEQTSPVNMSNEPNHVPQQMTQLNGFLKYLVFKFSSHKYASINEVPNSLPVSQVNYAKDKGRAKATIFLIGMTILGAVFAIYLGKRDHKRGMRHTDEIIKQHSDYSKIHQELYKQKNKMN